ncbi:unnamed protein product [Prorocentrum cordatum]|uniref:JmjC domain-containing protein n=1 Tax=Prorocentrum cordatum TaxID=2364126 RepID=A0ABN9R221_9DINO|nr:unnamed protein product [Polarella glacialis]
MTCSRGRVGSAGTGATIIDDVAALEEEQAGQPGVRRGPGWRLRAATGAAPRRRGALDRAARRLGPSPMWLHYDVCDNFLCCVRGRKRVVLLHPREVGGLYVNGSSSLLGSRALDPDADRLEELWREFPLARAAWSRRLEVELEAGDVLYIPALWPHCTEALPARTPQGALRGASCAREIALSTNVFVVRPELAALHDPKDVWANRELLPAQEALRALEERVVAKLQGVPGLHRAFYCRKAASALLALADAADRAAAQPAGTLDGLSFYRAVRGCLAQFGLPARGQWPPLPDDPQTGVPFLLGAVCFAAAGPNSRKASVFICIGDMSHCLGQNSWETPIGAVAEQSLDALDRIETCYGDIAECDGPGPDAGRLSREGDAYLRADFPGLTYIRTAAPLDWPPAAEGEHGPSQARSRGAEGEPTARTRAHCLMRMPPLFDVLAGSAFRGSERGDRWLPRALCVSGHCFRPLAPVCRASWDGYIARRLRFLLACQASAAAAAVSCSASWLFLPPSLPVGSLLASVVGRGPFRRSRPGEPTLGRGSAVAEGAAGRAEALAAAAQPAGGPQVVPRALQGCRSGRDVQDSGGDRRPPPSAALRPHPASAIATAGDQRTYLDKKMTPLTPPAGERAHRAGQSTEALAAAPLAVAGGSGGRPILCGDENQLCPAVASLRAAALGVALSVLARPLDSLGKGDCDVLLDLCSRMHPGIMQRKAGPADRDGALDTPRDNSTGPALMGADGFLNAQRSAQSGDRVRDLGVHEGGRALRHTLAEVTVNLREATTVCDIIKAMEDHLLDANERAIVLCGYVSRWEHAIALRTRQSFHVVQLAPALGRVGLGMLGQEGAEALSGRGEPRCTYTSNASRRAGAPPGRPELREAFHRGVARASLRAELAGPAARPVEVVFPDAAARLGGAGALESCWAQLPTMFGRGRAVVGVQVLLAPQGAADKAGAAAWSVALRVKVLARTTYSSQAGVHFAARLVAGLAKPLDQLVTVVPDHRPVRDPGRPAIDPKYREHLSGLVVEQGDAVFEELMSTGALAWTMALSVQDVGKPVEDVRYDDCC